jgi:hypothetical protein
MAGYWTKLSNACARKCDLCRFDGEASGIATQPERITADPVLHVRAALLGDLALAG